MNIKIGSGLIDAVMVLDFAMPKILKMDENAFMSFIGVAIDMWCDQNKKGGQSEVYKTLCDVSNMMREASSGKEE